MQRSAAALTVIALGVVAGLSATPISPGVVFEVETTVRGQAPQTLTGSVEGPLLKVQVPPDDSSPAGEFIFRGDRREMIIVDHENRSYMTIDEAAIEQLVAQMSGMMAQVEQMMAGVPESQRAMVEEMMRARGMGAGAAARPRPTLRRTGETATHGEYATVKYEVVQDGRVERELWVTPWSGLTGAAELRPAFEAMSAFMEDLMEAFASSPMGSMADMTSNSYAYMRELDGFPVLTRELDANGEVEVESLLKSSTLRTLAPADFEPPSTYTAQQLPTMPGAN